MRVAVEPYDGFAPPDGVRLPFAHHDLIEDITMESSTLTLGGLVYDLDPA